MVKLETHHPQVAHKEEEFRYFFVFHDFWVSGRFPNKVKQFQLNAFVLHS